MASKHTAQLPYPTLSYCTPLFYDGELYKFFCIFLKCTFSRLSETQLLTMPCSFCDNFQHLWQSRRLLIQLLHFMGTHRPGHKQRYHCYHDIGFDKGYTT